MTARKRPEALPVVSVIRGRDWRNSTALQAEVGANNIYCRAASSACGHPQCICWLGDIQSQPVRPKE